MVRNSHIILIVMMSVLYFVQCGLDSKTLATIGDLEITVEEFKEKLKQRYPKVANFNEIETKSKRALLDQTIEKMLKLNAAIDLNLENDPDVQEAMRKQEENLLGQKFFEVEVVDKLVSQEEIEEFNIKQGYEFKAPFILISYDKSKIKNDRTQEEAKKLAQEILQKARSGADFSELIIEFTDDKNNKKPTADFDYFNWGQKPKLFQEACWNLNIGDISDVLETSFGYYVIRLDDKRKQQNYVLDSSPLEIFRIKRTLYAAVADSGNKLWAKKVDQLKEEYSYTYNDAAVNRITQLLNEITRNARVSDSMFTDQDKYLRMVEWDGGSITLNTIMTRYKDNIDRVLRALRDPKNMKRELQNLSLITIALTEAKKMDLDEDELIVKKMNSVKEEKMIYLVQQKQVNDMVTYTDEEVREYYDNFPDQFMNPAKMEIWSITVKDKELAKTIAAKAKRGSNFEALAKKYSTDKYYKKKGGYLGFRTVNSRGSISRKSFELGANSKASDPFRYKNEWAIVKTGEFRDRKLRPFNEVVRMVEGRLRNDKLKERRKEWNKQLREKYPVTINEEVFNEI